MAYPYRENKIAQANKPETPQQNNAQAGNSISKDNTHEELNKLLSEIKEQLKENRNADEILMANLEGWTDLVAEALTESFVEAVKPSLIEQKQQLEKTQIAVNSLKDDVGKLKRIRGFKSFLIWLAIICNIGIAGYFIYNLLITKGVFF